MASRANLVSFNKEKNVMTCTTCIEFFQSDKISNPFISGCSNLRASSTVTDHEQSKTHMKAIVALSAIKGNQQLKNGI
jgi:hypothetical protein